METINILNQGIDLLLASSLLCLAWLTLKADESETELHHLTYIKLYRAIILFISFGFLMSLVWIRLDAPDIAMAEAAIGAGLTGALLLSALSRLRFLSRRISRTENNNESAS